MKKHLYIGFIFTVLFFTATVVWYSPVLFKGYPASINGNTALLSKNIIESDVFSIENDKHIILNSERIAKEGMPSSEGQKLLPVLSAKVYSATGLPTDNQIILISILISALSLVFFTATVWKMFGQQQALVFSVLYIFFPTLWETSVNSGGYEFALLFLSLALFVYFGNIFKKSTLIRAVFFGILLALAFLSRTALALLAPSLLLWMWFYDRKNILPVFISLFIIIGIFTITFQNHFGSSNNHHLSLVGIESSQFKDFAHLGHLYPDPYTYIYEKESFLTETQKKISEGGIKAQGIAKNYINIEGGGLSLLDRMAIILNLTIKHTMRMFSLQDVGGIFIFLLFLLGVKELNKKRKEFVNFLLLWIVSVLSLCAFIILAQRNHIMDFGFAYVLLTSFGITGLACIIKENISFKKIDISIQTWTLLLTVFVVYHFVLSTHVVFGEVWDRSTYLETLYYTQTIQQQELLQSDVIATPFRVSTMSHLSYLTDTSIVLFREDTLLNLIEDKKLDFVFSEFGVTHILGFNSSTTQAVLAHTTTTNIATQVTKINSNTSNLRSFLINLVR